MQNFSKGEIEMGDVPTSSAGEGEHYAWSVLLLVASSEKEAEESEDPAKDNRPQP